MKRIGEIVSEPPFYQKLRGERRNTMQATVTVEYVNPPKPGKQKGNIKTRELGYVWAFPDKLTGFAQGGVYMIDYSETPGNDPSRPWRNLNGIVGTGAPPPIQGAAPPPPPPSQTYQQPTLQAQAPLTYHADVAPGVSKECGMFVMGIIGRAMQGTGTVPDANTLTHMVANVRTAWEAAMEGKQEASPDDIPNFPGNSESPNPNDWQ